MEGRKGWLRFGLCIVLTPPRSADRSITLCQPDVVDHILGNLPTFTDNLRVPEPTTAMRITCGHGMRSPHFTQLGRILGSSSSGYLHKLPTFLELQSDYTASFAIAKQALKIPAAFAAHVANVAVSLHERSRHLVLGLALGRGAHSFGGGRLRYNLTSLKTSIKSP